MARGWGRNEEDLEADKESARADRTAASDAARREDAHREAERRSIDLSLARIRDQLARTTHPERRAALEAAKNELEAKRDALKPPA